MSINVPEKLKRLRAQMKKAGVAAYLVPSTDPHQSEYVPECWQRRQWASGFTGSAGDLVVAERTAGLWTDGRYFLQASQQLVGTGITLQKQGVKGTPSIAAWVSTTLKKGQSLGVDPRLLSRALLAELQQALGAKGIKLKLLERNLVDAIWRARPAPPPAPIEVYPTKLAGSTVGAKLKRLRKEMSAAGATAHVLTALDCIAWLFNIRSADVPYNPVAISYALVTTRGAQLFCDPKKVTPQLRRALSRTVRIRGYDRFGGELQRVSRAKTASVWVDAGTVNAWVLEKLGDCQRIETTSPIWKMKAAKNPTELAGIRQAHVRDGVAMVRFLCELEHRVEAGKKVTELSAARRLTELRAAGDRYRGDSFETISGYAGHGAIVHYAVTERSSSRLRPKGLFLIDSGGQYLDGTTDITRTVLLGTKASSKQRDRFTRVLKGHIALSLARFPEGTAGRQLDVLARKALWEVGLEYAHGTGHGVGCYLNVHEGPQAISPTRCTGVPLAVGNVLSNEPGYYHEGKYGIRIENLVEVVKDDQLSRGSRTFLRFAELTLCPIDTRLVEPKLLDPADRRWLNAYHKRVRETLSRYLDKAETRWLHKATRAVK